MCLQVAMDEWTVHRVTGDKLAALAQSFAADAQPADD